MYRTGTRSVKRLLGIAENLSEVLSDIALSRGRAATLFFERGFNGSDGLYGSEEIEQCLGFIRSDPFDPSNPR